MNWRRMRTDFDLATVTVFGVIAIVGITPFAFYRYYNGNTAATVMDVTIIFSIFLVLAYAWMGGNTKRAGELMTVATNLGCIASAALLGLAGLFWTFPVLLVNFLLLGRQKALGLSVLTLGFQVWLGKSFNSLLEVAMFLVSALVVCALAFIFAYRTETQRRRLQELALIDPLTGAQNRRALDRELEIAITANSRDRTPFGLAILDLDHFKRINDNYGHEEGDDVLVQFAELIKSNSRKMDRFFRMGGEEFVLLLPGAHVSSLQTIVDHHCKAIEKNLRARDDTVTVSIGATVLKNGEDRQEWLARADAALYAAKKAGRNCTVVDEGGVISK